MATIEERLVEFKNLSFEDQKEKMIAMLTDLQGSDQVFKDLLDLVPKSSAVTTDFLVSVYENIMKFAEAIRAGNKEQGTNQLKMLQEKIHKLHEIEAAERAQEKPDESLDDALSQI